MTQTATEKVKDVAEETTRQARDLLGEARTQVKQQAGSQHRNLVGNLRSLGDELDGMAGASGQSGVATELVGQARDRAHSAADWLDNRRPEDLVDELRAFARRRPGAFLLGATVAGVLAGRLTRGVVAVHSTDADGSEQAGASQGVTASELSSSQAWPPAPAAGDPLAAAPMADYQTQAFGYGVPVAAPAGAGYAGEYPPTQSGQYPTAEPSQYQGQDQGGQDQGGQYQGGQYQAGQYQAGEYQGGEYQGGQYQGGQYQGGQPGQDEPTNGEHHAGTDPRQEPGSNGQVWK